jgi:hypothetical protein
VLFSNIPPVADRVKMSAESGSVTITGIRNVSPANTQIFSGTNNSGGRLSQTSIVICISRVIEPIRTPLRNSSIKIAMLKSPIPSGDAQIKSPVTGLMLSESVALGK